jgi:16S rRNA (uracil1498-N3)-methyltransferase
MEIRRFFVDKENICGGVATVSGDEFLHATRVLRLKVGFKIVLATGDGNDYYSEITEIGKDKLIAKVYEVCINQGAPKIDVTIYQAVIKGGKSDIVVQKAVELGVNTVKLFFSENTSEREINLDRLNKVALEAAKQCHRSNLTVVEKLDSFSAVINDLSGYDLILMPYEHEDKTSIKEILSVNRFVKNVAIIIGSEGGFSEGEVQLATTKDIKSVSLGKRILRAETAAIATAAIVMYELGEMSA